MKLTQLVNELQWGVVSGSSALDREITGGYASDLLSCVMAGAQRGNIWVTLQAHTNVVAVAALLELGGVVISEGVQPDDATIAKAEQEGIPLLTTQDDTYTVVAKLAGLGVQGNARSS